MNYLAHTVLSKNSIEYQLGNLLADPLKGKRWEGASDEHYAGMRMHAAIDMFTDANKTISLSKSRLRKKGYLKGVVIDTHLYSRKERDAKSKQRDQMRIKDLQLDYGAQIKNLEVRLVESVSELLKGQTSSDIGMLHSDEIVVPAGTKWTKKIVSSLDFLSITFPDGLCKNEEKSEILRYTRYIIIIIPTGINYTQNKKIYENTCNNKEIPNR